MKTVYVYNSEMKSLKLEVVEKKEFRLTWYGLVLISGLIKIMQLAELLKASAGGRLIRSHTYLIDSLQAGIVTSDGNFYLRLKRDKSEIFLDKYEASYLSRFLDKIINKNDLPYRIEKI